MSGIEGAECEDFDDGEAGVGRGSVPGFRLRASGFGLRAKKSFEVRNDQWGACCYLQ